MSEPSQLSFGVTSPHRNRYLFSDHYLNVLLRGDPRWSEALTEAGDFLAWLKSLHAQQQAQLPEYNESQLEDHWFKPILEKLGHVFERQASVPGLGTNVNRPDYVFFPDEATRQAAVGAQKTEEYTAKALAVGEVKQWDTPLDKKQKGNGPKFEAQNPSWQIDYYVRTTGLAWGVLSNGRMWRLVHKDTSQRLSTWYEVDLVDLLGGDDVEATCYFTLFFRQAAFRPDAQGRVFLQDALAASNAYAVALEEDLERNAYQALEKLVQGFLSLPANKLGAGDLAEIYENSLYLLYRLLFILYGESRNLLPLQNEHYRAYSLKHIKERVAAVVDGGALPASITTICWHKLKTLFHIINGSEVELNRELGVPRYDGGLFNPDQHRFLEERAIGDRVLTEAVDLLSRRQTETGREFVDYRSLGVRHLGSIYEGLLEYQPRCAEEPTVAMYDGKKERWIKASEAPADARVIDRRDRGQVYLETDRGERKATGSYYTPQYIVEYIVENTLGPLVEEAKGRAGSSLVDEVLSLKVLDPAMGSGHFLVEATEYLALALVTDPHVEISEFVEEDMAYWKRRVVERCIYGVDRNPLAVELAKLSLWLATIARDKPLSFLDHHLKCGDSLIGAKVADLGWPPPTILNGKALKQLEQQKAGQTNMFGYLLSQKLPVMLGKVLEITEVESDSYETVQGKEAANAAVQQLKAPFQAVADLWVSAYFGNEFIQGDYDEALNLLGRPDELLALPVVQRAREMAQERRPFHWELEYPEVFYDQNGQPLGDKTGFDAVIGNPPYGFTEALPWFSELHNDAFVYFWKLGVDQGRNGSYLSLITPMSWLTGVNYQSLRQILLEKTQIQKIVGLPYDVFPDAYIDTCVAVVEVGHSTTQPVQVKQMNKHGDATKVAQLDYGIIRADLWRGDPFNKFVLNPTVANLQRFRDLPDFVALGLMVRVERGVQPYSRSKHTEEQIRRDFLRLYHAPSTHQLATYYPELLGEELSRYRIIPAKRSWLKYSDELAGKRDEEFFTRPRIVLRRLLSRRRELMAAITSERLITTDNILNILVKTEGVSEGYIATLLNSKLIAWIYTNTSAISVKDDFPQVTYEELNNLPIRRISFTTPAEERERLMAQARELYATGQHDDLLAFTAAHLAAEPEQSDVIHDLLAHLAGRMIEMNKQKQAVVKGFWLDLEGVTDVGAFEALRGKGKQESSLWRAAACRPFVAEDSHATRTLDESLGWDAEAFKAFVKALADRVKGLSDLLDVYGKYSPIYRELIARIEATDRLIDRIVYQLYGLTEEEIAIVEKAG